ncbi:MAG: transferase [Akkermansiaceae bacterium]|nr:transferase [Akkermansiaceae bacterium]
MSESDISSVDSFSQPSFGLGNRLKRVLWGLVWSFTGLLVPRPFHEVRSVVLRAFGAKIGRGVHVYPRVKIWAPWNLAIGDEAGVANGAILYSQGNISIGRRAVISQGAHLCAGTHDYEDPGMPLITKPIVIGDHAWVTAESFIHPGVTIGEGAVIGARSVVTKDMPEWMVCAGNPCKPLKARIMKNSKKTEES